MNNNYKFGLTDKEILLSRKKFGSNRLNKKSNKTFLKLIVESFGDPIIKILLVALCIKCLFLFNSTDIYESLGIFIAIFLAIFISSISEYGSEKAFEKLNDESSNSQVKVIRNGKKQLICIDDLVVGDSVILQSGDKIPADGIVVEGELIVDESILTGESIEKSKNLYDTVYMGTIVLENDCIIKINKVGENTFFGKISNQIQESTIESPLKQRLTILANQISKIGYICAIIIFLSYLFNSIIIPNHFDFIKICNDKNLFSSIIYALTLSVTVIVMAVPEGLPMMITLVLSSNMKKMLKKNVLVRKLVGIETSGSLNVLFTDKTGTLTEGKLKVIDYVDADLNIYDKFNKINYNYELVYQSLIYNNNSFIDNGVVTGNMTDMAILDFTGTDDRSKYKIIDKQNFNSKIKYSSVTTNYKNITFYKGAYEILLNKCNNIIDKNGNILRIDKLKYIDYINNRVNKGQRSLALVISYDNKNFILLGFLFFKDNIRKHAKEGINLIKNAGIGITIVTGDSFLTTYSIAEELNLIDEHSICLTSEEFNDMTDGEVMKILPNIKILCRSLPEDKNRLVRLSQECGLVVGMTGDGINDAPALKKADVGFAMGSGTEVAKETSDIIILDNNILSIANAILYGRTIFKSIRKFIIFQLSVNLCAVLLSIIGPYIGILTPVTIIQMLWINMVMDTFAGLAFSFEPALIEYMLEKPKKRNEKIMNNYMKNQILVTSIYSTVLCIWFLKSDLVRKIYNYNICDRYLLTAFFGLFIFITIFNAFNARTYRINILSNILKNKIFLFILFFISIVQILLIYYGGDLFRTIGLSFKQLEFMILLSLSILPVDMLRKIIIKKLKITRSV